MSFACLLLIGWRNRETDDKLRLLNELHNNVKYILPFKMKSYDLKKLFHACMFTVCMYTNLRPMSDWSMNRLNAIITRVTNVTFPQNNVSHFFFQLACTHQVDTFAVVVTRIRHARIVLTQRYHANQQLKLPTESPVMIKLSQGEVTAVPDVAVYTILEHMQVTVNKEIVKYSGNNTSHA